MALRIESSCTSALLKVGNGPKNRQQSRQRCRVVDSPPSQQIEALTTSAGASMLCRQRFFLINYSIENVYTLTAN